MDRRTIKALILNDDDLECDCDKVSIEKLNMTHLGFNQKDIEDYGLIVYRGKKGTKILKSNYFKPGKIE